MQSVCTWFIERREYFLKIEDSHVRSYLTYLTQTKEQRIYNFGKRHHGHKTKRNETKMKTESSQKRSIE